MTRFVFFETPREIVRAAAPLYAELAAMRMRVSLVKLMPKYSPDQPRLARSIITTQIEKPERSCPLAAADI